MIREMAKDKTIMLSTHNLEEVDAICSRVIIIAEGRLLADDTPEGLKTRSAVHGAVRFSVKGAENESVLRDVKGLPTVRSAEVIKDTGSEISIRAYPKDPRICPAEDIIGCFKTKDHHVESIVVEEGRLDDVFRNITQPNHTA